MSLHDRVFGQWYEKSTEVVIKLNPGIHLLSARAFGLKGYIGGQHSWVAQVGLDGQQHVFELTDAETLSVQGATTCSSFTEPSFLAPFYKVIYASDRAAGQRWFGAKPTVWKSWRPELSYLDVVELVTEYPHHGEFHVLGKNCNTFSSWLTWRISELLGDRFKMTGGTFVGARSPRHWRAMRHK